VMVIHIFLFLHSVLLFYCFPCSFIAISFHFFFSLSPLFSPFCFILSSSSLHPQPFIRTDRYPLIIDTCVGSVVGLQLDIGTEINPHKLSVVGFFLAS
jgi:hypothetical protein